MFNRKKDVKVAFALLASILFVAVFITSANAQTQASVTLLDALGGTTDPAAGTYDYDDGTTVMLTATPIVGNYFVKWQIVTSTSSTEFSDNPHSLTVTGGVTYAIQPIFETIQNLPGGYPVTDFSTAAIVEVLRGAGGTTNPPVGTYAMNDAENFDLTAIPDSGWQFSHWVISGETDVSHGGDPFTLTPTDNPYNVNHGYGYTYAYQPVFTPVGMTEPTPTPTSTSGGVMGLSTEWAIIIALVAVIIVMLIAFAFYATRRKK